MEELQDAIEDAQYLSAVSSVEDGPRPVLPWEIPTEEQLTAWKESVSSTKGDGPVPFQFEWVLSRSLGLFLFSAYLKEVCDDYVEINFVEEVLRWKATSGRMRADVTSTIMSKYLSHAPLPSMEEEVNASSSEKLAGGEAAETNGNASNKLGRPSKTEITEYDLAMEPITKYMPEKIQELRSHSYDASTDKSAVGLCGPVLDGIVKRVDRLRNTPGFGMVNHRESIDSLKSNESGKSSSDDSLEKKKKEENSPGRRNLSLISNTLPEDLFDEATAIVTDNIKNKHWEAFLKSEHYTKLLNFLWFQDRRVVEEDFFLMRVLGRGGFGLVTGELCSLLKA